MADQKMPAPGAAATVAHEVTEADIARTLGTGEVPVLASSRLLTWAEGATCTAIGADLDDTHTSVGTRLQLEHLQPSPLNSTVSVRAELVRVDGRLLVFEIRAEDERGELVGRGEVSRMVVEWDRFVPPT